MVLTWTSDLRARYNDKLGSDVSCMSQACLLCGPVFVVHDMMLVSNVGSSLQSCWVRHLQNAALLGLAAALTRP